MDAIGAVLQITKTTSDGARHSALNADLGARILGTTRTLPKPGGRFGIEQTRSLPTMAADRFPATFATPSRPPKISTAVDKCPDRFHVREVEEDGGCFAASVVDLLRDRFGSARLVSPETRRTPSSISRTRRRSADATPITGNQNPLAVQSPHVMPISVQSRFRGGRGPNADCWESGLQLLPLIVPCPPNSGSRATGVAYDCCWILEVHGEMPVGCQLREPVDGVGRDQSLDLVGCGVFTGHSGELGVSGFRRPALGVLVAAAACVIAAIVAAILIRKGQQVQTQIAA
jgi:hypothetical protein